MNVSLLEKLKVPPKNEVKNYLPVRNKGNKFLWKSIAGDVLAHSIGKRIKKFDFEKFEGECQAYFDQSDAALWSTLSQTYFADREALLGLDPRFSVLGSVGSKKSGAKANARMAAVFKDLLGKERLRELREPKLNFLELKILGQVEKYLEPAVQETRLGCYLPFLQSKFQEDLRFLSHHPRYMLSHFQQFLKFYAMAYSAQLALNVRGFLEAPRSRNLYFILAHEKAGAERVHVSQDGMKLLRAGLNCVFPILSMSEAIQKPVNQTVEPLWRFYQQLCDARREHEAVGHLNHYAESFAEERKVKPTPRAGNIKDAFKNLIFVAQEQFRDTGREGVNKKYVAQFEEHVFQDYTQSRGRAGKVLVLGQDQLLLITNLVIGDKNRLWFKDVLSGFEARGVFLDKRSETALVNFYERIGNVERKSDSGDAIYITKTL